MQKVTPPIVVITTGGTIDKVVVDVSGEKFVDHEKTVMSWFAID